MALMSNLGDEIMIPPQTNEENKDRLSELPEGVILHILSFLNAIYAVQTCVLSKRWKHLWKHVPALILHYPGKHSDSCAGGFYGKKRYKKFVSSIFTLREASTALQALDFNQASLEGLDFDRSSSTAEPSLLQMIANYVVKHSLQLQRLSISFKSKINSYSILQCISSCQALTSLKLAFYPKDRYSFGAIAFPRTLNLPALTTLELRRFVFWANENEDCAEPFSAFHRLNSLILRSCGGVVINISSSTLVNLTIEHISSDVTHIKLSTPNLSTFSFTRTLDQNLCGKSLSSVKQMDLDVDTRLLPFSSVEPLDIDYSPSILFSWLLDLHNIKSLVVTPNTLQVLSFVPNLLKLKISSLCNLKSLKVKLKPLSGGVLDMFRAPKLKNKTKEEAFLIRRGLKAGWEPLETIPDGVVDFLLQNSPDTVADIVDYWQ